MVDPADGTQHLPADAATRMRAAEDRLYPLAMVDVERYQRGTTLCGLLLDDLRAHSPDLTRLLGRRAKLLDRLPGLAGQAGLSLLGLDPETLVDAAMALRCRELEAERAHAQQQERLASARENGQEWLVDEPSPAAVMAGFYRREELHVPTGSRLVSSVEVGATGRPTAFVLEVIPPDADGLSRSSTFDDEDSWLRAATEYRSEISGRP
ncbi:MAG TPA: hypothetical protein VLB29_02355 [Nocardioidaceae bacterium]|nr:hypothetical protein [Nocardioidaceae bacterium]